MCRLLLSYKSKNSKQLLLKFMTLSETENCKDGYGISQFSKNKWKTYKQPFEYLADPSFPQQLANVNSNIIMAHIRKMSQIRESKKDYEKEKIAENTHPFQYENHVFMQHGDLFVKSNSKLLLYQNHRNKTVFKNPLTSITKYIKPEFFSKMNGTTDTELLFYLFLSIQQDAERWFADNKNNIDNEKFLVKCISVLLQIIKMSNVEINSNFVYANGEFILAARIYKNNSGVSLKPVKLYIDTSDGIVICSSKITENAKMTSINTIHMINIKTGSHNVYNPTDAV